VFFSKAAKVIFGGITLVSALRGHARADVIFGYDGHAKSSVSFIEFNTATKDTTLTEVSVTNRTLKRTTAALVRMGSGAMAGKWLKISIDSATGLVTRITSPDNSRIDLTWSKTTGYRSAQLVLRDAHGQQNLVSTLSSSLPMDFYAWKDWGLAGSAADASNWNAGTVNMTGVGQAVAGILDRTDHVVNALTDRMLRNPKIAHSGVLVARILAQTKAEASGMMGQPRNYVGKLAGHLLDHGVSTPLTALEKHSVAVGVIADALARTVRDTYTPTVLPMGYAEFVVPSGLYAGNESHISVARKGGAAGILSGRIWVDNQSGIKSRGVSFADGNYFVFPDGATKKSSTHVKINSNASGRTLILDMDQGDGTVIKAAITNKGAPPPNTSFSIAGSSGAAGESISNGCGYDEGMELKKPIAFSLGYSANTGEANASIDTSIGIGNDVIDYTWSGTITWNGSSFVGTLYEEDGISEDESAVTLTVRPVAGGRYAASVDGGEVLFMFNVDFSDGYVTVYDRCPVAPFMMK